MLALQLEWLKANTGLLALTAAPSSQLLDCDCLQRKCNICKEPTTIQLSINDAGTHCEAQKVQNALTGSSLVRLLW